jgi:broad specificity phosphatase PhoE
MPNLILIKHASPVVDPAKPAQLWRLSDLGREKSRLLAERLRAHQPQLIVASEEPKAQETATIVAEQLGVQWETAPGLHEHDRSNVPHMRSGEFISMMELFFRRPSDLVLGKETAEAAANRFGRAVEDVVRRHGAMIVAIVSHGTVLATYLAPLLRRAPFELWRELGLPSYVVIDAPEMTVREVVPKL